MPVHNHHDGRSILAEYADQSKGSEDSLVIPEDLSGLADEDLNDLSTRASDAFQAIYDQGIEDGFTDDTLAQLSSLTEGLEALNAEQTARQEAATKRAQAADELATRIGKGRPQVDENGVPKVDENGNPVDETGEPLPTDSEGNLVDANGNPIDANGRPLPVDENGKPIPSENSGADVDTEAPVDEEERRRRAAVPAASAETESLADQDAGKTEVTASARKRRTTRINLSGVRRQAMASAEHRTEQRDTATAAPDVPGFAMGQSMNLLDLASAVDGRMASAGLNTFAHAASQGRHIRQQYPIASIHKDFKGLVVNDPASADEVIARATDEKLLEGGSLVASGGWCAPSETIYDLFNDGSSRDGLLSIPEIQVQRGGIRYTKGPDYTSIYAEGIGFHYTEQNDIDGKYGVDAKGDGNGTEGTKPCFKIGCTEFEEARLELDGLCISAGLLESRGYPELIARTIELALIAHDHRMSARKINELVAGSTAILIPSPQVGATAPVLTAIELQVQHYRYSHRLPQNATLEAVLPYWVHGVIRSDLSRRLGIDLLAVNDTIIDGWFTARGISAQFVYDWQALDTTAAASFTAWPETVQFLLYQAGTWVAGGSDVITLNNLYDSTLLGENDYTALFTEEGYLVAKKGLDSRVVTVPLQASGETGAGVLINHNGTEVTSGS